MNPITPPAYLAPAFFVICACTRCFLETQVVAKLPYFSYYTCLHHLFWYLSTILAAMGVLHLILNLSFSTLNRLFYSGVLLFIPVFHSMLTQTPLHLEYLKPDVLLIIRTSATACLFHPTNSPQFWEILAVDMGIMGFSLFYSQSWKQSFLSLLAVHVTLTLFGVQWFYSKKGSPGAIGLVTHLPGPIYLALIWTAVTTALVEVISFRNHWLDARTQLVPAWAVGSLAWATAFLALKTISGNAAVLDALLVTLPVYTLSFLGFLTFKFKKNIWKKPGCQARGALLTGQLLSALPILLNTQHLLAGKPVIVPF